MRTIGTDQAVVLRPATGSDLPSVERLLTASSLPLAGVADNLESFVVAESGGEGRPIYAHWGVPDPASAPQPRRYEAFRETLALIAWRIDLMLALPLASLEQLAVEERLRAIGQTHPEPATHDARTDAVRTRERS
jgi:hypothetical protein